MPDHTEIICNMSYSRQSFTGSAIDLFIVFGFLKSAAHFDHLMLIMALNCYHALSQIRRLNPYLLSSSSSFAIVINYLSLMCLSSSSLSWALSAKSFGYVRMMGTRKGDGVLWTWTRVGEVLRGLKKVINSKKKKCHFSDAYDEVRKQWTSRRQDHSAMARIHLHQYVHLG